MTDTLDNAVNDETTNTSAAPVKTRRPNQFQPGPDPRRHTTGRPKKDILDKKVAPTEPNIKQLARTKSQEAIKTLYELMSSTKTPPATRLAAANALLDRGYGKPQQTVEATVSTQFDKMSDEELVAYIAGKFDGNAMLGGVMIEGMVVEEMDEGS